MIPMMWMVDREEGDIGSLCGGLGGNVGVNLLAVLVVSDSWGWSTVASSFSGSDTMWGMYVRFEEAQEGVTLRQGERL